VRRRDLGLQDVRASPSERARAPKRHQPFAEELPIPSRSILRGEQDRQPLVVDAGVRARSAERHDRQRAERLGLARHEVAEQPREAQRLRLEVEPHQRDRSARCAPR
jgi:hypothetical protein